MTKPTTAYIGLGSNLGDRESAVRGALKMLSEAADIEVARVSDIIESAALGGRNQPDYVNAVAEIKTTRSAEDLHKQLSRIETSLGRNRGEKWSSRVIDLDLLVFGQEVTNHPELTIPHPQMHLRSFVLKGLCQLNAELVHPVMKEPMKELAARLGGMDFVLNSDVPELISVAGIIGVGKTTLTKQLSKVLDCKALFEAYDTNPFMADVYAGRKELALDSQLYFLASRTSQLNLDVLEKGRIAITDYIFDKEFIYARRLLNAEQLALYEQISRPFTLVVAAPVLVIYLRDSAEKCLERIHKRNRPYEQAIEQRFLEDLSCDYEQLFSDWKTCPVIRLSMSEFDCTRDSEFDHLANQIRSYAAA